MKVIAKPGQRCPMEGKPRQYITDDIPVEVPETTYYRRLVREGSLVLAPAYPAMAQGTDSPREGVQVKSVPGQKKGGKE